jgi:predicted nucleotidyltransferase
MKTMLEALATRYSLAAVYVFGSRAAEIAERVQARPAAAHKPEADVDIAVQSVPGRHLGARERAELTAQLENLFAAQRVDLLVLPEADPFMALDAIRGELLFCADPDDQAEYELYVLRRAGDLAPFARQRWDEVLRGTAR